MIPATMGMRDVYFQALLRLKAKSVSAKMTMADPPTAYRGLTHFIEEGRAVEVGDYLILFDVGHVWYSPHLHLIEELTMRFQRVHDNPVESAVAALDVLAYQHGAKAIGVGDTQIGLMTPYYLAAGYTPLGTQLFKEVSYGVSP
jgi:hypothetical protein